GDPAGIAAPLEDAVGQLQAATMWLAQNGMADPNNAGAGAYAYMQLMGLVSLGWMWLKMAGISAKLKNDPNEDRAFHDGKIATARFYATRELVGADALRRKIEAGADSVMALPQEAFSAPRLPLCRRTQAAGFGRHCPFLAAEPGESGRTARC